MIRLLTIILFIASDINGFSQQSLTVGQRITGDFNGDGKTDTAFAKLNKTNNWTISFSDKSIASIHIGCCDTYLINEGDLNHDKTTELSVFQAPENGCTYLWSTYTFRAGKWTKFIKTFLVPTYCDSFNASDLEKEIFIEKGKVYYLYTDPNDVQNRKIKKQVAIK
jgi:hypothetical protein